MTKKAAVILIFCLASAAAVPAVAQDVAGSEACEAFLKKYEDCLTAKLPATSQPQARNALNELRGTWRAIATDPATRSRFATICRQSTDLIKEQTVTLGCEW